MITIVHFLGGICQIITCLCVADHLKIGIKFIKQIDVKQWKVTLIENCPKRLAYNTGDSQAVSDPSTNPAQRCLTCQIGRDGVCSTWYGRKLLHFFKNHSCPTIWLGDKNSNN